MNNPKVNCPHCGKSETWSSQNPYRPFCSERCKLIDLGQWAGEAHRIPGKSVDDEVSSATNKEQNEDIEKED